jgi:hypothetical protein
MPEEHLSSVLDPAVSVISGRYGNATPEENPHLGIALPIQIGERGNPVSIRPRRLGRRSPLDRPGLIAASSSAEIRRPNAVSPPKRRDEVAQRPEAH